MDRSILHVDANCFYASVEMLHHPELAGQPIAVGGDAEARHGIILTANYIAKDRYGAVAGQTGLSVPGDPALQDGSFSAFFKASA